MEIAPDWLAIIGDEVHLRLHPRLLRQIELERSELDIRQRVEMLYKIDSKDLVQVLASSLGYAPNCKATGALIVWTYYDAISPTEPILRTLIDVDGDLSQKASQDMLRSPIANRLIQAHSYVIGQISQQLVTVISDYIARQLQPFNVAFLSFVTTVTWQEPLQSVLKNINLSSGTKQILTNITGNSLIFAFTITVAVLVVWWIFYRSPLAKLLQSRLTSQQLIGQFLESVILKLQQLGKKLLELLESKWGQRLAIASMVILGLCWLLLWQGTILPPQWQEAIIRLESILKPYLPIALVSTRKKIQDLLWKLISSNFGLLQSIFQFFMKRFKPKTQSS